MTSPAPAGVLDAFTRTTFTYNGETKDVYRAGSGPGVVVMSEMPGITPNVVAFAQRVVDAGFTVAMPQMFGTPGKDPSVPYVVKSLTQGCVSKEFSNWALNRTSPIIDWLRALARDLHEQCGGPGVGAIGMCFTGGFALAMAVDDTMLAPVLSQPSLPFAGGKARKRALGLSDADLATVAAREDLCVLALRFTGDGAVPKERFEHLRDVFGDRLIAIEIDSSKGNPHNLPKMAHSVVTEHLVDEPGHPTQAALDRVLAFFQERLST
jgi:dienelactone hydrolase